MENDSEMISLDADDIKRRIFTVRGKQVMLDSDLAEYFGTTTGNLNRAMKRNIKRFPENFCFQLSDDEISRCQIGISMQTQGIKGGRSYLPFVYTEQGIAMLTSVLHTETHQKIFFDGQIYDAFSLLTELIQKAEQEIILIDGYVDVGTLNLLAKKQSGKMRGRNALAFR